MELIVEESEWTPRSPSPVRNGPPPTSRGDAEIVAVRIRWDEAALQAVKAAGGRGLPKKRVWELAYDRVADLGLEDRIVEHGGIQM